MCYTGFNVVFLLRFNVIVGTHEVQVLYEFLNNLYLILLFSTMSFRPDFSILFANFGPSLKYFRIR